MQTLTKEQIAVTQLIDALKHYYNEEYISAITLAGAADEILARLADGMMSDKLGHKMYNNYADEITDLFTYFSFDEEIENLTEKQKETRREKIRKTYLSDLNKERNELKHSGFKNENISADFKLVAEKSLSHAIVNLQLYKQYLPTEHQLIKKYCSEKGINGNEAPPA